MFATEIVNVCIIQPHLSVVGIGILKIGDINHSNQCAQNFFAYERRMSVANTETGLLPSRLANLCE